MWALVFFQHSSQHSEIQLTTSDHPDCSFSVPFGEEGRWEFLANQGCCVSHTPKGGAQLKRYDLRQVRKQRIGLQPVLPGASTVSKQGSALCRGTGAGWLGSSALPPVSHQRKQRFVFWRRSIFPVDFLTDSAPFPCHLRALLLALRSQPSSVTSQAWHQAWFAGTGDRASCGPRRSQ